MIDFQRRRDQVGKKVLTELKKRRAPSDFVISLLPATPLAEHICTDCSYVGVPERRKKGKDLVEVMLWVVFAICAALYVVTRGLHVITHYHFPGEIVRLCSLFAKLFLAFSVVYTLWQSSTEYKACPKCGNTAVIPLDSPRGQKLLKEQQREQG